MKKTILLCLLLTATLFAKVDYSSAFLYKANITSKKAHFMQNSEDAILIDVRTIAEFKKLRAKNSINIPIFKNVKGQRVFNKNFLNEVYLTLDKNVNKKVILICRSGSRTKLASNLLAEQGFRNVYNIKKGFTYDWAKTNLPTEK